MTEPTRDFTPSELLAVLSARLLTDGQIVFAGIGIPLLAASLAQQRQAPHLTILFEGGAVGPAYRPGELPLTTNDQRCIRRACAALTITDTLLLLQRGYVDVGFMGGAQIDRFGNLNSSFIGDPTAPKVRLPGTGGGNDIVSFPGVIVTMLHEKRRFIPKVDFITSPGWLDGGDTRAQRGLPTGGPWRVVTDRAILGYHERTREMMVIALHPGITREEVQDNTGFELRWAERVETTPLPSPEELAIVRHLDPERRFLG